MVTGDSKTVADSVAKRIGIDEVAAEVVPADKAPAGKRFQAGGKREAIVGDGVNEAPALATADVGWPPAQPRRHNVRFSRRRNRPSGWGEEHKKDLPEGQVQRLALS